MKRRLNYRFFLLVSLILAAPTAFADSWTNTAFRSQTGNFNISFNVTPGTGAAGSVAGISSGSVESIAEAPILVRFNTRGTIDVRSGSGYNALATVNYTSGSVYHFDIYVHLATHTYSVFVTPPGQSAITLAESYPFGGTNSTVASLNDFASFSAQTGNLTVANLIAPAFLPLPPSPTGLVLTSSSNSTLNLSWSSGGGNTVGYQISVSSNSVQPSCAGGVSTEFAMYSASHLLDSTNYVVSVCAVNADGGLSAPVSLSHVTAGNPTSTGTTYYVSSNGNDSNDGKSTATPWKTIQKINNTTFADGDTVLFEGGQYFNGCLLLTPTRVHTLPSMPFTIGSYGTGDFTLTANCSGTHAAAVTIDSLNGVILQDAIIRGNSGGAEYGVLLENTASASPTGTITIQRSDIGGFYASSLNDNKSGGEIMLMGYQGGGLTNIRILNNQLHGLLGPTSLDDNGVTGNGGPTNDWTVQNVTNVLIEGNTVYDIGGHLNAPAGEVGNGILGANINGGLIQNNVAHDNGGNVTTCGGPAGIWAVRSSNIVIQSNESYHAVPVSAAAIAAAAAHTACDWDGFDIDIDVTNLTMQYNYSHDNYGSGYNIFGQIESIGTHIGQWGPNTIRYNVSENDALGSFKYFGAISIGVYVPLQVNIYNNTIYSGNNGGLGSTPVIAYDGSAMATGLVANNIFYSTADVNGKSPLVTSQGGGSPNSMTFINNSYFSKGTPSIIWGKTTYTSVAAWTAATGQDSSAKTANPLLLNPGLAGTCANGTTLASCLSPYLLQSSSPLNGTGLNLNAAPYNLYGQTVDIMGLSLPSRIGTGYNIGASGSD